MDFEKAARFNVKNIEYNECEIIESVSAFELKKEDADDEVASTMSNAGNRGVDEDRCCSSA